MRHHTLQKRGWCYVSSLILLPSSIAKNCSFLQVIFFGLPTSHRFSNRLISYVSCHVADSVCVLYRCLASYSGISCAQIEPLLIWQSIWLHGCGAEPSRQRAKTHGISLEKKPHSSCFGFYPEYQEGYSALIYCDTSTSHLWLWQIHGCVYHSVTFSTYKPPTAAIVLWPIWL